MRRSSLSILSALLILSLCSSAIGAGVNWCRADPTVRLNGTSVQIWVAIPEQYVSAVTGPTYVEVNTPGAVTRELVSTDAGFGGNGEDVRFGELKGSLSGNSFPTQVWVKVPIDKTVLGVKVKVPLQVEVAPDNAPSTILLGDTDGTDVRLTVTGQ